MKYLGDFATGAVVQFAFNTRDSTSALTSMTGSPVVKVYKHGNTTEVTTGVTLTESFDSRTGFHTVAVDTSADGTFYATANEFYIVLTAGAVDGVSQVGTVLAQFSIGNRGGGGGGGLDAAGVRSAVGLATNNLDTQLSAISNKTTNLPSDPADASDVAAAFTIVNSNVSTVNSNVTDVKAKTDTLPSSPAAVGSAMTLDAATDVYWAMIDFDVGTSADQYTVSWTKNGDVITSGITVPKISVTLRGASGTTLVSLASMTQIGSTGAYYYDEGSSRVTSGSVVLIDVQATIDGSTRRARKIVQNNG